MKGQQVDLIIHNAEIHTMDEQLSIQEAIAIRDGKIIEVGPERQILNKYRSDETIDALGKDIYPGFTDTHGHIFSYAKKKMSVDLVGCKSMDEVIYRCEKYLNLTGKKFIVGHGWNQNLFSNEEKANCKKLNEKFKHIPVCLYRIDGRAALVNKFLINQAKISACSPINGEGEIQLIHGEPSGLLIDNAMKLVEEYLPKYSQSEWNEKILEVQQELLQYGVTGVHEAGIEYQQISQLKKLMNQRKLKLNVYAMLLPTNQNLNFARKHGPYQYRNLAIRSFKFDERDNLELNQMADFCLKYRYQMNLNGIEDSAASIILDLCKRVYEAKKDHRFRLEGAEIIHSSDFQKFSEFAIFPSIQPSRAVSDSRWNENQIGKNGMYRPFVFKSLLNQFGMLAVGTNFPTESINPFLTIHAAVQRKNKQNQLQTRIQINETLSLDEVIKGMTIWAAFSEFSESKRGSLEKGKEATLSIFDKPVFSSEIFVDNFAWKTFINGELVYEQGEL